MSQNAIAKVSVVLSNNELRALRFDAERNCRRAQDQARFYILKGLGIDPDMSSAAEPVRVNTAG